MIKIPDATDEVFGALMGALDLAVKAGGAAVVTKIAPVFQWLETVSRIVEEPVTPPSTSKRKRGSTT